MKHLCEIIHGWDNDLKKEAQNTFELKKKWIPVSTSPDDGQSVYITVEFPAGDRFTFDAVYRGGVFLQPSLGIPFSCKRGMVKYWQPKEIPEPCMELE